VLLSSHVSIFVVDAGLECGVICDTVVGTFTPDATAQLDDEGDGTTTMMMTCQEYLENETSYYDIECSPDPLDPPGNLTVEQASLNNALLADINDALRGASCCEPATDPPSFDCTVCRDPLDLDAPPLSLSPDDAKTCGEFVATQESLLDDGSFVDESFCKDLHTSTVQQGCCACDPTLVDCNVVVAIETTDSPTMTPSSSRDIHQ